MAVEICVNQRDLRSPPRAVLDEGEDREPESCKD
jgi:hypothetical protein